MEVFLMSIFSAIIIAITVFFMIKVFIIAHKRNEITRRKFLFFSSTSIVIGIMIASVLPFGYQRIVDYIL